MTGCIRKMTLPVAILALTLTITACGDARPPGDPGGLDEATEMERRLGVGKGDSAGSCAASCGGKSANGTCWCDDLCEKYGDCCDDRQAICEADAPCFVTGCSGQVCADTEGLVTICDFKPEYACYGDHSTCGRQADGACGWAPTEALAACLADPAPVEPTEPVAPDSCEGRCGGEASGGDCYCDADCAQYGDCCADKAAMCDAPAPPAEPCFVGGCSGQLCGDTEGMISTCEWTEAYACYLQDFATCERQADGACGWTQSEALLTCLDDATNACSPVMCEMACEHGFATDATGCEVCACNPPPSACAGHCGGKAPEGCWCDASCEGYGDCCPGKSAVCE